MNIKTVFSNITRIIGLSALLASSLTACGGGGSSNPPVQKPPIVVDPIEEVPANTISHGYFRDQDSATGRVSGTITLELNAIEKTQQFKTESIWVYWADAQGDKLSGTDGAAWLKAEGLNTGSNSLFEITIPAGTVFPSNNSGEAQALILYPRNGYGEAETGTLIKFHDFIGNAHLSGPGGSWEEDWSWYYGTQPAEQIPQLSQQREKITIQRTDESGGLCILDNGLVSVIDMAYERDVAWEERAEPTQANVADDSLYRAYEFNCDEAPVNTYRQVVDDDEGLLWTYSSMNDAMYYGTAIHDTFMKYLGEPPLEEKIRVRLHYGGKYFKGIRSDAAFWDGAYANFGDGYPFETSMMSFDVFAHEVGHGVLNRLMDLTYLQRNISTDVRTLHEAFGDISGVVAWYELTGDSENYWDQGYENGGGWRKVNSIRITGGGIESYLDYRPEDNNFYHRIGMVSYPFYLMTQKWGIESAYRVYINSAKNCWYATDSFVEIAQCIKQQAGLFAEAGHLFSEQKSLTKALTKTQAESDVELAFKAVKIKLFENGVLSHFYLPNVINPASDLSVQFTDDSRSTGTVNQWLWDFGDGTTSTDQNPLHTYTEAKTYTVSLTVTNTEYVQGASDALYHKDDFSRKVKVEASGS